MNARISIHDNASDDPMRAFSNTADFCLAVSQASLQRRQGQAIDRRLGALEAAAPGTAGSEGIGSEGGFLVPPGIGEQLFTHSLDEESLLPLCDDMPVDGNSMSLPTDETTPWDNSGPRAYWTVELGAATPTKPEFTLTELKLKKLMALVPVSNELFADAPALASYLPRKLGSAIRWESNLSILFGTGAGKPAGALVSPAAVTVPADAGQLAGTLSATNIANMVSRLPPGSLRRAIWLVNNDVLPALWTLTLGNQPIYLPAGAGPLQASPYGTLAGRPVVASQMPYSFGDAGDVVLLDLSYYQTITKASGVSTATSMHLYFDADAMAYLVAFRLDGGPKLTRPISSYRGGAALSPFVQLAAR